MKTYRFWYHYNKPESNKRGVNVLTLHWKSKCIMVEGLVCNVPTESHNKNSQPRCVIRGWCTDVSIEDEIATIE